MTENVSSDQTVILSDVRTSYFYGFEPYKGDNGDSYCSHFLMAPDHPGVALIKAAQRRAATAMWKDGAEAMLQALAKQDRLCLHDGDTSKPGVDGYKGMLFVSGNSKKRFTIVDGDRSPLTAADGRPYSGCYVNAIVQVWAQQNKWGKRINAQISGVQFLRHGESFGGGRVAAPEEFGVVSGAGADSAAPAGASAGLV
jgi:hypothetical protein